MRINLDDELEKNINLFCFVNNISKKDFFVKVLNDFFRSSPISKTFVVHNGGLVPKK